ncbi:MAG: hypothetical protein EXS18_01085 [Verrucomicrobiae bacterium]|nr:hypothetical protein [Verrucomicrobiae bacterium]
MNEQEILEYFGKLLMKSARDQSIMELDWILKGESKAPDHRALQEELKNLSPENLALIRKLLIKAVDKTLHYVLSMIEQNQRIDIVSYEKPGEVVSLRDASDGLAGELYSGSGWIANFSAYK